MAGAFFVPLDFAYLDFTTWVFLVEKLTHNLGFHGSVVGIPDAFECIEDDAFIKVGAAGGVVDIGPEFQITFKQFV